MIHFVSFFEPVAIASTQVSSVGITIHYRTLVAASASNCIHALRKNNNIVTIPTRDVLLLRTSLLQNVIYGKYTRLHTLIAYALLTQLSGPSC